MHQSHHLAAVQDLLIISHNPLSTFSLTPVLRLFCHFSGKGFTGGLPSTSLNQQVSGINCLPHYISKSKRCQERLCNIAHQVAAGHTTMVAAYLEPLHFFVIPAEQTHQR